MICKERSGGGLPLRLCFSSEWAEWGSGVHVLALCCLSLGASQIPYLQLTSLLASTCGSPVGTGSASAGHMQGVQKASDTSVAPTPTPLAWAPQRPCCPSGSALVLPKFPLVLCGAPRFSSCCARCWRSGC